jgi:hypothetical protein
MQKMTTMIRPALIGGKTKPIKANLEVRPREREGEEGAGKLLGLWRFYEGPAGCLDSVGSLLERFLVRPTVFLESAELCFRPGAVGR